MSKPKIQINKFQEDISPCCNLVAVQTETRKIKETTIKQTMHCSACGETRSRTFDRFDD